MNQLKRAWVIVLIVAVSGAAAGAIRTEKPVLHGRHWMAITGKPLGATAGASIFLKGGNAVDAACAMLASVCTMYDVLSWGGETQALIYNPKTKKVIALNALGVAPTGATPEFFRAQGLKYPPATGPLAAVTPGTPGGLMTMLAEFGTMGLKEVLGPAIQMADGYPAEREFADSVEKNKDQIKAWPYSRKVLLPHPGERRESPSAGEIFRQPELAATLRKLVEAESRALAKGKSRREAIYAAYERFYRGDIAREFVRGCREQGGLITAEDLAKWQVHLEEPVTTNYRGIDVYKLTCWVQGPVMLQALNILENFDLQSLGYNSAAYIHLVYQAMNLAFADRDFYYGDPYFPPDEPIRGLLSKDYARSRLKLIDKDQNDPLIGPGDPYPFEGGTNPYRGLLEKRQTAARTTGRCRALTPDEEAAEAEPFLRGTTSVQSADEEGWVVSMTPSGGWIPACLAGETGIGMSQRMQSFVLDEAENPFNVVAPGKRPRATLTPGLAMKNGRPFLSFAVQGGDTQDQNLLQFFLDVVEFGMTVQEACEAANFNGYQMKSSFDTHAALPGRIDLNTQVPAWVKSKLESMGYKVNPLKYTSGPINAIFFDEVHGTFWGGSSNYGEDYGIAW
jgi:gamma-glutamyltranspeptidase / glutathione hydrolase